MPRDILTLNWNDFDNAMDWLVERVRGCGCVYGEPRGGLVLAVALSHRLGIPLVGKEPQEGMLWIDDIVDSGKTLVQAELKLPAGTTYAAWVERGHHNVIAPIHIQDDRWILFPWEQTDNAQQDAYEYSRKRGV